MSTLQKLRNSKKFRLIVIILLILLVIVLYFRNVDVNNLTSAEGIKQELQENYKPDTWDKKLLMGIGALLGIGLGMEATNNDYDLGKLIDTKGDLKASRVLLDKDGNVVSEEDVKSGRVSAKYTDEYNCDDFKIQEEEQRFFEKAGGVSNDTNRLDGNKDGIACQALPKK